VESQGPEGCFLEPGCHLAPGCRNHGPDYAFMVRAGRIWLACDEHRDYLHDYLEARLRSWVAPAVSTLDRLPAGQRSHVFNEPVEFAFKSRRWFRLPTALAIVFAVVCVGLSQRGLLAARSRTAANEARRPQLCGARRSPWTRLPLYLYSSQQRWEASDGDQHLQRQPGARRIADGNSQVRCSSQGVRLAAYSGKVSRGAVLPIGNTGDRPGDTYWTVVVPQSSRAGADATATVVRRTPGGNFATSIFGCRELAGKAYYAGHTA
jgi:hypothetical protein